ncbi:28S ribosomal protein S36, mitochondrial [Copidosoma floridanum]|uniref:28S ribosomal protein S36, mitochondrial n=1 Tax=Copidosoma floridanum TaxID=29053 RepID=UPI0006C9D26D|nr:28S ribosomal protein S36, mitochondrial [Copidosoma floridanum]
MASKGWKIVQAHVPLIRFRKGGNIRDVAGAGQVASALSGPGPAISKPAGATGPNVVVLPTIDDSQLQPRFRRRMIDSKEIEYINRGGPE